jgi:nucleoside-triphosphatase
MKKIFILTGSVHSGKTTRLMHWALSQKNIDGITQPIVDDKRFIYNIASRTLKLLEAPAGFKDEQVNTIGKYRFNKEVFEWSQKVLLDCLNKDLSWLIIDEIGPLELGGKGLEPALTNILLARNNFNGKILCVVRDSILDQFIAKYSLKNNYEVFSL